MRKGNYMSFTIAFIAFIGVAMYFDAGTNIIPGYQVADTVANEFGYWGALEIVYSGYITNHNTHTVFETVFFTFPMAPFFT
jgi:hypothetical protein